MNLDKVGFGDVITLINSRNLQEQKRNHNQENSRHYLRALYLLILSSNPLFTFPTPKNTLYLKLSLSLSQTIFLYECVFFVIYCWDHSFDCSLFYCRRRNSMSNVCCSTLLHQCSHPFSVCFPPRATSLFVTSPLPRLLGYFLSVSQCLGVSLFV